MQRSASRKFVSGGIEPRAYKVFTQRDLEAIPQLRRLPPEQRRAMKIVSSVLPFRVNEYVLDELIDWSRVPDDPIFQLTFPQRQMLAPNHYERVAQVTDREDLKSEIQAVRAELNPHPAGQLSLNMPRDAQGNRLDGLQHKYRETVLFFPSQGQTCHAYCSFCFRWAQFVGDKTLRIASTEANVLHGYLARHPEVTDLLITGGDPMVMKTTHLKAYLEPLLRPELEHVRTVRIGTKALTFWPYRFVTDEDSDDLLRLLERLVAAGKHVAIMAHYNHWQELSTQIGYEAIRRIRDTGAQIRSQGPLLNHVNTNPDDWAELWRRQVGAGIVPYYMFVERDTGASHYFEVPLAQAWEVYRGAMQQVSGLARTARGPSMSAGPGKVEVQGVTEIEGEKVFALRFIQGRNPDWVQRPFFARYDEKATWLDQLKPALGAEKFFFEDEYASFKALRSGET